MEKEIKEEKAKKETQKKSAERKEPTKKTKEQNINESKVEIIENATELEVETKEKSKKLLIIGLIFIIIAIVMTFVMYNSGKEAKKNPAEFSSVTEANIYSSIDVNLMTYSITDDYSQDTVHIVGDSKYYYLAKVKFDDWEKLSDIRDYTYSDSAASRPQSITIYGKSVPITEEFKQLAIKTFNSLGTSITLTDANFEDYFGEYYLDTSLSPSEDTAGLLALGIIVIVTIGSLFLVKYFKLIDKLLLATSIFLGFSWIMFFVVNTPTDFEDNRLIILGLYLIILSTVLWIYALLKKKTSDNKDETYLENNTINNSEQRNATLAFAKTEVKSEQNEYIGKSKEKILQMIYKRYDRFISKNEKYLLYFSGWDYSYYNDKTEEDDRAYYLERSTKGFLESLFMRILLSVDEVNEEEKQKAVEFLKNIDSDTIETIESLYELDKAQIMKEIEEDSRSKASRSSMFASEDFDDWLVRSFDKLASMKGSDWTLTEDEWRDFLLDIEEAYNAYVEPTSPFNILKRYKKTTKENAKESTNKAIYMYYVPLILVIGMIIGFVIEFFGEPGMIMSGGWWSVGIFVFLIIWTSVGGSGKSNTCSTCHKWNGLRLDSDTIISSRETWRTKTVYENGRNHQRQVVVRIDEHKEEYTCTNCGAHETKYRTSEHEL